ncbi:putative YigZ family protein [Neorhizobium huautlense]|uniref:YigZ family protein n=1 Tax=Neorhizobium huautlense TaxID=67774 RepID=A0ABT9PY49_9HYPH|nr:YigZ family protein [Neorhizobium huautlense]MDP9839347.1 putative YigZ family protein [Neorhizobium huautlense]
MFQLAQAVTFEQVIKNSRFAAIALPVSNEEEVKAALAEHGFSDANHNCWAWRIGSTYRFSDDGEPSGTAGKPILAAIDGQSLDQVLVIVTRWFGGILLGSGGLVRAYGGTAAACLRAASLVEVKPTVQGVVGIEFSDLARVKAKLLAITDLGIAEEQFTATGADLVLRIPEAETETVSRLISDLTSGRAELKLDEA